ncbi:MAG TPA: iron transporter [Gammaproteobacteria bacterium]
MSRSGAAKTRAWGRRDIAARAAAAVIGGYVVAAMATTCLAKVLPLARSEATAAATLLSFLFYTAAILWSFAAPSAVAAWVALVAVAGLAGIAGALAS